MVLVPLPSDIPHLPVSFRYSQHFCNHLDAIHESFFFIWENN